MAKPKLLRQFNLSPQGNGEFILRIIDSIGRETAWLFPAMALADWNTIFPRQTAKSAQETSAANYFPERFDKADATPTTPLDFRAQSIPKGTRLTFDLGHAAIAFDISDSDRTRLIKLLRNSTPATLQ